MGLGRKAARLMEMENKFIELPEEIIYHVISFLTLKEAVRTSVLSRSWRYHWTCHPDLWFDSDNVLGTRVHYNTASNTQTEFERQLRKGNFIERVNQIMDVRCQGLKIDSFSIHFHLGKESSSHIDRWISCVAMKRAEKINLDFSELCSFRGEQNSSSAHERYEFPPELLAPKGKKCSVKHLRLASCSLGTPPSFNNFITLKIIELHCVNVDDYQLNGLLLHCLQLEALSLHQCKDLINLNFSGSHLHLKFLKIDYCSRLRVIEIHEANLVMFEYTGHFVRFSFRKVTKLVDTFLNFTPESRLDGVAYALTELGSAVPHLENLNLFTVLVMKMLQLPRGVQTFTNIKQLILTIFPFDDEDKLIWLSYILTAFPLLQKLQLNLFCASFIRQRREIDRLLPERRHVHLTEIEINGFYFNKHEVDLLKYLLNSAVSLKLLVVSPAQKIYKGFNSWGYGEASSWSQFKSAREWLLATVPPSVDLQVG